MKRLILAVAAVLLLAGGSSLFAADDCGCSFQVDTPNHTQTLGGKSGTSSHGGLHRAADNSPAVDHVTHDG